MQKFLGLLVFSYFAALAGASWGASPMTDSNWTGRSQSLIERVQYSCGEWSQRCAEQYGGGTARYRQCMGQPAIVRDCGGFGGGYRGGYDGGYGGGGISCREWQQRCAGMYGWRTIQWQQCMTQPAIVNACQGRY